MSLKLEHLKKTLQAAQSEAEDWQQLKNELKNILGPTFDDSQRFGLVVEDANHRLDALEKSGKFFNGSIDLNLLETFLKHSNYNVRKLASRFVPVGSIEQKRFLSDSSPSVRFTAARSSPVHLLQEAVKKFPDDDNLKTQLENKKLQENNVLWKQNHHQLSFDQPTEKSKRKNNVPVQQELSKTFYDNLAGKFLADYGTNLEYAWEELLVKRYVSSIRATSLIEIDHKKLLDAIMKRIGEKEDHALGIQRVTLREIAENLMSKDAYIEDVDPREELMSFDGSDREFLLKVEGVYSVKASIIPKGIRKYRISEGMSPDVTVPMKAKTPTGNVISVVDEKILDRYVETWNRVQALVGEPLKLDWQPDAIDSTAASFFVVLK